MNKEAVKNNFLGKYLVSCLHIAECKIIPKIIDDEKAVKKYFFKKKGYELDLDNPQTFSEKDNWLKLNDRNPLMVVCADKYAVREYVTKAGYGDLLNDLYGVYDSVKQIDIDKLPEKFVLKAAHGSDMGLIVTDKSKVNWKQQKALMSLWLKQDIYWSGREWVYKDMPKRIIAEKYLEDETGELKDYKIFCFNGKAHFMKFYGGRYTGNKYANYYDRDLNFLPVSDNIYKNNDKIKEPLSREDFEKMVAIAEDLAKPFQHVRVDFYLVKGKIYFGEMTFFHSGGCQKWVPNTFDSFFGQWWNLKK